MQEIEIKSSKEKIYKFTTDNKLDVYLWPNKKRNNTYITLTTKCGSIYTDFKVGDVEYSVPRGTHHYLEHLKFQMKDIDANKLIFDLGCETNAYTSLKETSYEVSGNSNIHEALGILLDFVFNDYFTKKSVSDERGIILEEARMNQDNPDYIFYLKKLDNYFPDSIYKDPVIGYETDINKITIDDISLVYDTFYRPENMFLIITGNFDLEETKNFIINHEKDRPAKPFKNIKLIEHKIKEGFKEKKYIVKHERCMQKQFDYAIKTNFSKFKGYSKKEVLIALRSLMYTNFGVISDFRENMLKENPEVSFSYSVNYDNGIIGLTFEGVADDPEYVTEKIKEQLRNISLTKEDLELLKKSEHRFTITRFENIYNVADFILTSLINNNEVSDDNHNILNNIKLKTILDIYKNVNLDNDSLGILEPND